MPFPDLPPDRIPGSPGHLHDHELIDQALDYVQTAAYKSDPNFPPLPDIPVLGQSGHVTAHDRIRTILEYLKNHPALSPQAQISNTPTGTYQAADGHNYAYYRFTTDGTLTVTAAGEADVLLVSGGSGGGLISGGTPLPGGGGWMYGTYTLDAGSFPVVVGEGGPGSQLPQSSYGRSSSLGEIVAPRGTQSENPVLTSTWTGATEEYGRYNQQDPRPNYGDGGKYKQDGASGVVIVRVRTN